MRPVEKKTRRSMGCKVEENKFVAAQNFQAFLRPSQLMDASSMIVS